MPSKSAIPQPIKLKRVDQSDISSIKVDETSDHLRELPVWEALLKMNMTPAGNGSQLSCPYCLGNLNLGQVWFAATIAISAGHQSASYSDGLQQN
jgi:hypothetical protein